MKYFLRSSSDIELALNRCYFEADIGRAVIAVWRLHELSREIPGKGRTLYAEGVIRREHLGQGVVARARFEQAYREAVAAQNWHTAWFAACNASHLARDAEGCRYWTELAINHCPAKHESEIVVHRNCLQALDQGTPYFDVLLADRQSLAEENAHGALAAVLDVLLRFDQLDEETRLAFHKQRALALRALDLRDEKMRGTRNERFPPIERIAVRQALKELNAALKIDRYDATLWNSRSVWLQNLDRHWEAIEAADEAIKLRPSHYGRPHVNKAFSFYRLKRFAESVDAIQEGLRQAREEGAPEQIAQAEILLEKYQQAYQQAGVEPTLAVLLPELSEFLESMEGIIRNEVEQVRHGWFMSWRTVFRMLVGRILGHHGHMADQPAKAYVPMMAQLLGDFTPETAFAVMLAVREQNPAIATYCFAGCLYLAAHSTGVQQRDAVRLVALMILSIGDASAMRQFFRQQILETSAAAKDEMCGLASLLRKELDRIHPELPRLIADQGPVDAKGIARATHDIHVLFSGPPPQPIQSQPSPTGCATVLWLVIAMSLPMILSIGLAFLCGGSLFPGEVR